MLEIPPGGGKTRTAIEIIRRGGYLKTLVVCKRRGLEVWPDMFEIYWPNGAVYYSGSGPMKTRVTEMKDALDRAGTSPFVFVVNYDVIWQEPIATAIKGVKWDLLIMDESHSVKKPGGKRTKFLSLLSDKIPFKVGMTGTLLADKPIDVYGQFRILDPKIFGTNFVNFRSKYAVMDPLYPSRVLYYRPENREDFRERLNSITFRVSEDVIKLIPPVHKDIPFIPNSEAKSIFKAMKKNGLVFTKNGPSSAGNVLARFSMLQQISSGFIHLDDKTWYKFDTSKEEALADLIEDLDGEPIVVFCQFHRELESVKMAAEMAGVTSMELSGRLNQLDQWKKGESQILATQIQAGGDSIDLTRARYVVYYSTGHSLTGYLQSLKRSHRPGQTRPVTYFHLVGKGTLDKEIARALEKKQEINSEYAARLMADF